MAATLYSEPIRERSFHHPVPFSCEPKRLLNTTAMAKRSYNRRSDDELIGDLQKKIADIQDRMERSERKDSAVLKELPKVQRALRRFAKLAMEKGREDLYNSTTAFLAGLERAAQTPPEAPSRNPRLRHVD